MTVLYLSHSIENWGGIERILVDKMNYLADKCDLDVYLLTTDQGYNLIPFDLSNSIIYEDLGMLFIECIDIMDLNVFWLLEKCFLSMNNY